MLSAVTSFFLVLGFYHKPNIQPDINCITLALASHQAVTTEKQICFIRHWSGQRRSNWEDCWEDCWEAICQYSNLITLVWAQGHNLDMSRGDLMKKHVNPYSFLISWNLIHYQTVMNSLANWLLPCPTINAQNLSCWMNKTLFFLTRWPTGLSLLLGERSASTSVSVWTVLR